MAKKNKQRKDGMVLVDPKILAAVRADAPAPEAQDIKGNPLIIGKGEATIGEGVVIKYDPDLDFLLIEGKKVPKIELWQVVFAISDAKTREQLMPVRQTEVMQYTKVHMVQLKKDMRAGEVMKVRCHTSVPLTVVEGLKGMVEKEQKQSIILPH